MGNEFQYELKQTVQIASSGETGTVEGRAMYTHSENTYYLHYKAADGRATDCWWPESTLRAV